MSLISLTIQLHQILVERIKGRTLEDVGNKFGITRERVRQILTKIFSTMPKLQECKYEYVFNTYDLSVKEFTELYQEKEEVYYFLDSYYTSVKKGDKKDLDEMLDDNNISQEVKGKIERKRNYKYIQLGKNRVKKERDELIRYVIKTFAKDEITIDKFIEEYKNLVGNLGLEDNPKFELQKGLLNKLADLDYILWSLGKTLRYYNIGSIDFSDFIAELRLEEYKNIEIGALKLLREHADLMVEYDIRNEYELHNLLKKLKLEKIIPGINFSRMPIIKFGEADKEKQIKNLMFELAPIKPSELAEEYESRYGIAKNTVLGSIVKSINKYLHNGNYEIEYVKMPENILMQLKDIITDDYYLLEDVKALCTSIGIEEKDEYLNSQSFKRLGYKTYSGYIVKDTYTSAKQFFETLLLRSDHLTKEDLPNGVTKIMQFDGVFRTYKNNYDIIEYEKDKYLNISKLENFGPMRTTKKDLEDYCYYMYKMQQKSFFTVASSRKIDQSHPLYDLGFGDYFYNSILAENKNLFSYKRTIFL